MVVALPLVAAWPARTSTQWLKRLAWLLAGGSAVGVLSVASLLWCEVWSFYAETLAPDRFFPLLAWGHLLKNGGQTLFGILLAGLCIAVSAGKRVSAD